VKFTEKFCLSKDDGGPLEPKVVHSSVGVFKTLKKSAGDFWTRLLRVPFFHSNLILGFVTGTRLITGLLKTKLSAVFLGTTGAGLLGIGGQVQMLSLTWGSLSMGNGFLDNYSIAIGKSDLVERRRILATTFTLQLISNGLCIGLALLLAPWLSKLAFGDGTMVKYLVPVLISVPFYSLITVYFSGIFFAHGQYASYSRASVVSGVLEAVLFASGMYYWGLLGAFWALPLGVLVLTLLLLRPLLRLERARDLFRVQLSVEIARFLVGTGFVMILTGSSGYLCSIMVRVWIGRQLGIGQAGIYQVLTVLFGYYSLFITNGVWAQLFPKASREGLSPSTCQQWRDSFFFTVAFGGLIQVVFLVMPEAFIGLVYSKDFVQAAHYFPVQCLADFIFLLAQPSLGVLLGVRKTLTYLWLSLAYYGALGFLSYLFLQKWGLLGISFAYLISSVGMLTWALSYFLKSTKKDTVLLWVMGVFAALVVIQGLLAWYHAPLLARGSVLAVSLGWMAVVYKGRSGSRAVPLELEPA
jgi:PST family polysaccharide transporter